MLSSKIVSQVMTWLEVEEHRVTFPYQRVVSDGGAVFRSKIVGACCLVK